MQASREDLEAELQTLSKVARARRSVDGFTRAALEGFGFVVLAGVSAKLIHDSARMPLFAWPLLLLDAAVMADALQSLRRARRDLRDELDREARLRAVREQLGLDQRAA